MPAARVLPPVSPNGLLPLAAAIGWLHGTVGSWLLYWFLTQSPWGGMGALRFGYIRVILAIAVSCWLFAWIVGRVFARVHPSSGRNLLAVVCYAPMFLVGSTLVLVVLNPALLLFAWTPSSVMAVQVASGLVVVLPVCAIIIALFVHSGWLTERWFGKRVVVQDGLTCWSCGYNLGAAALSTCPECGSAFDPLSPPREKSLRTLSMLKRTRRPLLLLAALLSLIPVVYIVLTHTIPCARFLSSRPADAEIRHVMIYDMRLIQRGGSVGFPLTAGWFLPDRASPTTGITVQYVHDATGTGPVMCVARACLTDPTAGASPSMPRDYWFASPGNALVSAVLSREQADHVIETRQLPPGLINALHQEADRRGWSDVSFLTPAATTHPVDPDPFFPMQAHSR